MMKIELPQKVDDLLRQHRDRCTQQAQAVRMTHGSVANYLRTLRLEVIDRPDDRRLEEFHRLYTSVFTLEDESEPIEGFRTVIAFNHDPYVQREFGPFIEPIFLLRDLQSDELVAAANAAIYGYPNDSQRFCFDSSCQLNFLLVRDDHRGLGLGRELLGYVEKAVIKFSTQHSHGRRFFTTCEQNNPGRMTTDQIVTDATSALITPFHRGTWWHRRGFRRLDMPYVQPPLNSSVAACTYLDYYIRYPEAEERGPARVLTSVLLEHLRRFFVVSVGKFEVDMDQSSEWLGIKTFLSERSHVDICTKSIGVLP